MKNREDISKVAVIGLGRVGSAFIKKFAEFEGKALTIVAAAESNLDAPGVEIADRLGIPVYETEDEIMEMTEGIDVIFNLTGNSLLEWGMKERLEMEGNRHTVIVSRNVALLIWNIFVGGSPLENDGGAS